MSEIGLPKPKSEEARAFMSFARKLVNVPKAEVDAQAKAKPKHPRKKSA